MDELYIKHSRNYAYGKDLEQELKELEKEERFEECMVVADIIRSMEIAETLNEKKQFKIKENEKCNTKSKSKYQKRESR